MKKLLFLIVLFSTTYTVYSQLGTPTSMYFGNQLIYNPGYAGVNDALAINLTVRKMWIQIPGSPSLVSFNAHAPFENDKHAVGLVLQQERWGPMTGSFGYANYAYKIYFSGNVLSLGLQAGFLYNLIDWDKIEYVKDPDDPGLRQGRTSTIKFDANVGAFFHTPTYFVGFSVKHLAQPKYDNMNINGQEWYSKMRSEFFLMGGYHFDISDDFTLTAHALLRYVHTTPLSVNLGLQAAFLKRFRAGASWQSGQRSITFFGKVALFSGLEIGYAYDTYYGAIQPYQKGSHEILLSYYLDNLWHREYRSSIQYDY